MDHICDYCDYHNSESGLKEMNTPLLQREEIVFGSPFWIVAIIENGYLQIDGESGHLDRIPIHFCPICGRRLD